jgi:protein phosphatase
LADGIGGHNAGEIASALAVEIVYTALRSRIANCSSDDLLDLMAEAFQTAHGEISAKARTSLSFMGMGTTLVVAVVRKNMAYIAHAGDSRVYHFQTQPHPPPNLPFMPQRVLERGGIKKPQFAKGDLGGFAVNLTNQIPPGPPLQSGVTGNGRLLRITNDHTMGDQLLANGIPREQIQEKQFHNLTQAIGCGAPPLPDFSTVGLSRGDLLLLCSDGLTDMLVDSEIEAVLANGDADLDTLAANLIDAANANGGRDNVSVVLVKQG